MWDRSITSGYQSFPLLQQLQMQGTKQYIQFPCVLSEIFCHQYTKFGKQFIFNTLVRSCLTLHPIHLENSKSTGLLENGEVRSLPITARQRNQTARTASCPHPISQGHRADQHSCPDNLPVLLSGGNLNQNTATVALGVTGVITAVSAASEPVTTKATETQPGLCLSSAWLFFTLCVPEPVTALHRR